MDNFVAFVRPVNGGEFVNERVLSGVEYSITLEPLPENWTESLPVSGTMDEIRLAENQYFVLGDNRTQSHDSRHFGTIDVTQIEQKVLFRLHKLLYH